MSIADKMNYLLETKNQIKEAIKGKGVAVSDADSFRSYANKIGEIQNSGSNTDEFWNMKTDYGSNRSISFRSFNRKYSIE